MNEKPQTENAFSLDRSGFTLLISEFLIALFNLEEQCKLEGRKFLAFILRSFFNLNLCSLRNPPKNYKMSKFFFFLPLKIYLNQLHGLKCNLLLIRVHVIEASKFVSLNMEYGTLSMKSLHRIQEHVQS